MSTNLNQRKSLIYGLVIAITATFCLHACTTTSTETEKSEVLKASTEIVSITAETEKAIEAALDKLKSAVDNKDIVAFRAAYTTDAAIYGTAPEEAPFAGGTASKAMEDIFASDAIKYTYSVLERDILLQSDGKTAIAVEQGISALLSKNIQYRTVSHLVPSNGQWLINFQSFAMIPENKDLKTLDAALE